jgi:hypothetical protein
MQIGFYLPLFLIYLFVVFLLASFSTLTVTVNQNQLSLRFGYGLFRKSFQISDITSAKAVKNRWYYGWGIRVSLIPYMWIYNVSGFDAVEIVLKNRRVYRIGTDEPKTLERALKQMIK